MQYRTCPDCGAALDPGEKCDCRGKPVPTTPKTTKPKRGASRPPQRRTNDIARAWKVWEYR